MPENADALIQEIVKSFRDTCHSLEYSFGADITECTATNAARVNRETILRLDSLINSGDILVDISLRSIYLAEDIPLEILCILPTRYPEMVKVSPPETFEVFQLPYKKSIGVVSYNNPVKSDPERGIIGIGYNADFTYNQKASRTTIDILVEKEES